MKYLSIVFRSSHSELRALLDGLIGGDGHTRANGRRSFIQQNPATMDMVQALCCRLGIRSTIGPNTGALTLTLGSRTATTLRGTNGKHEPIGRESYTGIVWCPSVPSTFWLARRDGRPFITGNTWPAKLAERLILSMCPREVCTVCGEPRRRVEGCNETRYPFTYHPGQNGGTTTGGMGGHTITRSAPTLGWTDCGHDDYRPGLVLDPFAGSATTCCVAELHGRDSIAIDFDSRNRDLMPKRMEECKRALFGTMPELPGQLGMFDGVPA